MKSQHNNSNRASETMNDFRTNGQWTNGYHEKWAPDEWTQRYEAK